MSFEFELMIILSALPTVRLAQHYSSTVMTNAYDDKMFNV